MLTGRFAADVRALDRMGIVDRDWEPAHVALLAFALSVCLAAIGAERVRRRPLPIVVWLVPPLLWLGLSPHGAVRYGLAAALLGAAGVSTLAVRLHAWRRPTRPWRLIALTAAAVALSQWLAWSVGAWAALAVGGAWLAVLPVGWRPIGPPSRLRRRIPWVVVGVAVLSALNVLAYVEQHSSPSMVLRPVAASWVVGLGALASMGVLGTLGPGWRAVPRAVAAMGLWGAVGRVAMPPDLHRIRPAILADALAPSAVTVDAMSVQSATLVAARRPAVALWDATDGDGAVDVLAMRDGPRSRMGYLGSVALRHGDAGEGVPLEGTVADVLATCEERCVVAFPVSDEHRAADAAIVDAIREIDALRDGMEHDRAVLRARELLAAHRGSHGLESRLESMEALAADVDVLGPLRFVREERPTDHIQIVQIGLGWRGVWLGRGARYRTWRIEAADWGYPGSRGEPLALTASHAPLPPHVRVVVAGEVRWAGTPEELDHAVLHRIVQAYAGAVSLPPVVPAPSPVDTGLPTPE